MSTVQGHRYINRLGNLKYFGTARGKDAQAESDK